MVVLYAFFAHLYLGLIRCSANTSEMQITCIAGTFTAGERASVTCMFDTDMSVDKRGILIEHHGYNSPVEELLVCHWKDEQQTHQCTAADGSTFDEIINFRLRLEIPTAGKENAGSYICYTVPAKVSKSQPCEMDLRESTTLPESTTVLESTTTVGTDSYTKDDNSSSAFLVVLIICVVVFGTILAVLGIIIYKSRRTRSPPTLQMIMCCKEDAEMERPQRVEYTPPEDDDSCPLLPNQSAIEKSKELVKGFYLSSREGEKLVKLLQEKMGASTTDSVWKKSSKIKADTSIVIDIGADVGIHLVKLQGKYMIQIDESSGTTSERLQGPDTDADLSSITTTSKPFTRQADAMTQRYNKPKGLRTSEQLFDYVADRVKEFVQGKKLSGKTLRVDLVFFFQTDQEQHLTDDKFTQWTRTSRSPNDKAENARTLLLQAFKEKEIPCELDVGDIVSNDVSTLFWAAQKDPHCKIALVVDEVYNACYQESTSNAGGSDKNQTNKMVHKVDFGAIWEKESLDPFQTDFDKTLDKFSDNPGNRIMEKMVCLKYLGEIIRLILEELNKKRLLFRSRLGQPFSERGVFTRDMVSLIECEANQNFPNTQHVLKEIQVDNFTDEDCRLVQYVTRVVVERAAHFAAAGLATIINRIGQRRETVTVAVATGTLPLHQYHPHYRQVLEKEALELLEPGLKFKIVSSCVGSQMGATLRSTAYTNQDLT